MKLEDNDDDANEDVKSSCIVERWVERGKEVNHSF